MHRFSKLAIVVIITTLITIRVFYIQWNSNTKTNVLTWDAFGYYLLLPAQFIYKDVKKMDWVPSIIIKYNSTGNLYQLSELQNGNMVMKYFLGVSILYSPFFIAGHIIAGILEIEQDGFSLPYQLSICAAAIFYALLGLILLRWTLLHYFSDKATAISLVLITLATNYVQYVSVDSGMAHGYIFTLYALILALTIKWHNNPTYLGALIIGLVIGFSTITRPTEGIMLSIPLLYATHDKIAKQNKWKSITSKHFALALLGGIVGILPQLIYWKSVTGEWIYDVGSKWTFLQPNWQVLFGWEKGWFIYTPVAIFMIIGLFHFRKNPFYWSILIFCILNIWIVTAWDDWRYGASYSARGLIQSYSVLALPLAAIVEKLISSKFKWIFLFVFLYLTVINLFQIWQYNKTILHYNDMNRQYYQAIYLNPHPTPVQMSLLDTKEIIRNKNKYVVLDSIVLDTQFTINVDGNPRAILYESDLKHLFFDKVNKEQWILVTAKVLSSWGAFETNLITQLSHNGVKKETKCRLQNGISKNETWNTISYYFKIPGTMVEGTLKIYAETQISQNIQLKDVVVKFIVSKQ